MQPVNCRMALNGMLMPIARFLIGLALTLSIAGLAVVPALADAPAPDRSTAHFEVKFMEDMMEHHHMAVMMAELCLTRATEHEALRDLCQNIIATQMQEMHQLHSWLEQWYGVQHEPMMSGMGGMQRLERLSGAEFEIAFMQMMIRHHESAIREANKCLDRAYHSELEGMCQNIIATQSAEIQQMQTWLCDWYAICKPH